MNIRTPYIEGNDIFDQRFENVLNDDEIRKSIIQETEDRFEKEPYVAYKEHHKEVIKHYLEHGVIAAKKQQV